MCFACKTFLFVPAITFELVTSNRYKLNKKYRALLDEHVSDPEDPDIRRQVDAAKVFKFYKRRFTISIMQKIPFDAHLKFYY